MKENIFIHFLNRELYRAVGIKKFKGANYVLKIMMLCNGEMLCIPLSSIWECVHVADLDYNMLEILYDKKQIEICSDCITVDEFIYRNRDMYRFDEVRYEDIYFKVYKKLVKLSPTKIRSIGATEKLDEAISNWDHSIIRLPQKDKTILNENRQIIECVNYERENKALTVSLFREKLLREEDSYSMARFLSMMYIDDYCKWLNADIVTGIGGSIQFFDILAEEYPYHDVQLLSFILYIAGIRKEYLEGRKILFWDKIIEFRALFYMENIHTMVYEIINTSIRNIKNQGKIQISTQSICRYIKVQTQLMRIKEVNEREPYKFLEHLTDNMTKIYQVICGNTENTFLFEPAVHKKKTTWSILKNVIFNQDTAKMRNIYYTRRKIMKIFIVHGHEDSTKLELKNYIQNTLKLGEPIILAEKASGGLTIIEKFEKYASDSNLVFVLLTPDDVYGTEKRARQNVILEMGYFLGKLGRKSGRVILLHKGDLDIPSDISGLVYIKIDNGIEAAGEEIRKEISAIV